ncbi:hypothetical protein D3C75_1302900 [compost metagenome]
MHYGEEHQRRDGGLDQLKKNIAEDLELGSQLRREKAEGDPQNHSGDDLEGQVFIERFFVEGGHICDLVVVIGER